MYCLNAGQARAVCQWSRCCVILGMLFAEIRLCGSQWLPIASLIWSIWVDFFLFPCTGVSICVGFAQLHGASDWHHHSLCRFQVRLRSSKYSCSYSLIHAHRVSAFSGSQLQYVVLLFVCYGVSVIPLMYLASFMFGDAAIAYTRLTMFNIATGLWT